MKNKTDQEKKTRYQMIKEGLAEPEGIEKGWMNLQPIPINTRPPEEQKEICRKGAAATNKIHGEKKTARESLQRMLSILATPEILQAADIETALVERLKRENPGMTLYDVLNAAAIGRALGGNVKAAEYVRDTVGDKPKEQFEVSATMTDQDREMLQQINARLQNAEILEVIEQESGSSSEREKSRKKEPKKE